MTVINILIFGLDDDELVKEKVEQQMAINNIHFEMFTDSESFLKEIHRKPHIVFIDYRLPGALNGLEITKILTTDNPDVKVIMISGLAGVTKKDFDIIWEFHNKAGGYRWIRKGDDSYDFVKELIYVVQDLIAYYRTRLKTQDIIDQMRLQKEKRQIERKNADVTDNNY